MKLLAAMLIAAAASTAVPHVYAQETRSHTHAAPAKKKTTAAADTPFGREGDARKVKRVIKIEMSDAMRYFPDSVRVKRGDTVRFNVHNSGQLPHEMVIGTMDELKKHAAMMRKENEDMAHDEPYATQVAPGEVGRIVWQFSKPGEFYYACLIPGHLEAGMIGTIVVR